jgi:hypothetical protein
MLLWFNPVIYLLKNELKNSHEYEVDAALIKQGVDAKGYQMLLIKKAVGTSFDVLVNTFSQSSVSLRIRMMMKRRSGAGAYLKYAGIACLTFFSVIVFARPGVENEIKSISKTEVQNLISRSVRIQGEKSTEAEGKRILDPSLVSVSDARRLKNGRNAVLIADSIYSTAKINNKGRTICLVNRRQVSYKEFMALDAASIKDITVVKGRDAVKGYGLKTDEEVIVINTLEKKAVSDAFFKKIEGKLVYVFFMNGVRLDPTQEALLNVMATSSKIPSEYVESTVQLQGRIAVEKYGEKAVVEVYLKKQ